MRSSTSSPSPSELSSESRPHRVAVIACGAIARPVEQIAERRGLQLHVYPLPPLLHNHPSRIAGEVERLATDLTARYDRVVVGYADCGSYGALDTVCARLGLERLAGLHCYDLYGGAERVASYLEEQPGTYLLTDFLVRSFARSVLVELGLDRYPDLRDAYFGNYTRVVWLAQERDSELEVLARRASEVLDLPLVVIDTGTTILEQELIALVTAQVSSGDPASSALSHSPG